MLVSSSLTDSSFTFCLPLLFQTSASCLLCQKKSAFSSGTELSRSRKGGNSSLFSARGVSNVSPLTALKVHVYGLCTNNIFFPRKSGASDDSLMIQTCLACLCFCANLGSRAKYVIILIPCVIKWCLHLSAWNFKAVGRREKKLFTGRGGFSTIITGTDRG